MGLLPAHTLIKSNHYIISESKNLKKKGQKESSVKEF
jgi:hypothetical protein